MVRPLGVFLKYKKAKSNKIDKRDYLKRLTKTESITSEYPHEACSRKYILFSKQTLEN